MWLLGAADDPHLDAVQAVLQRAGVEVVRTCGRDRFRLVYDPVHVRHCRIENRSLARCAGAYVRRLPPRLRLAKASERPTLDELYGHQLEADAWRDTVWALLRHVHEAGRMVLNPPGAGIIATPKLDILRRAHRHGLRIPETLVTSSVPEGTTFVQDCEQAVAKPVRGGALATLMLPGDERLARLPRAPVTLQQRIFGPDVRVVMLEGRVLCASRLTGLSGAEVDFRADPAFSAGRAVHVPEAVDDATVARLAALSADVGARLCGVDLKASEDGYVFLELNLAPAYREQERALGVDVTGAIAAALVA